MHTTVMVGGHERVGAGNRVTHDDRTRTTSTVRIDSSAPNAVDGRYLPIVPGVLFSKSPQKITQLRSRTCSCLVCVRP
jgi:hypothetical protein